MAQSVEGGDTSAQVAANTEAATVVLVIDDDRALLHSLVALLEGHGFQVLTAPDGIRGLQLFRQSTPDVILTDIIMPEQDGIAVIMEMRRERPDVKIIAMSGGGQIGHMEFLSIAGKLGADATIPKPTKPEKLIETLRLLLRRDARA